MIGPGNVCHRFSVVRWYSHSAGAGSGFSFGHSRCSTTGQANMCPATTQGANTSSRERTGRGFSPALPSSQALRSCKATTWQAQPQKKRPNTSVLAISARNSRKPALILPSSTVCIASDGSTGVSVLPVASQCQMCAPISTWMPIRNQARLRDTFDGRTGPHFGTWRSWRGRNASRSRPAGGTGAGGAAVMRDSEHSCAAPRPARRSHCIPHRGARSCSPRRPRK